MNSHAPHTLYWCEKHENWFQYNCPQCFMDANEDGVKKEGMRTVVEWIKEKGVTGYIYTDDFTHITTWDYETSFDNNLKFDLGDWQSFLKENGIE